MKIELLVNGKPYGIDVEPRRTLADALRIDCGLTGTHLGCEHEGRRSSSSDVHPAQKSSWRPEGEPRRRPTRARNLTPASPTGARP